MKYQIALILILNLFIPNSGQANQDEINQLKKVTCKEVGSASDQEIEMVFYTLGEEIFEKRKLCPHELEVNIKFAIRDIEQNCKLNSEQNFYNVMNTFMNKLPKIGDAYCKEMAAMKKLKAIWPTRERINQYLTEQREEEEKLDRMCTAEMKRDFKC